MCAFKLSHHQGTLPLSSPGGRAVNMTIAVEEFILVHDIWSVKCGLDQVLFSKGYELTFKEKLEARLRLDV